MTSPPPPEDMVITRELLQQVLAALRTRDPLECAAARETLIGFSPREWIVDDLDRIARRTRA